MSWLVLDTATPVAVVGVVRDGRVLSEHVLGESKKHAEGLVDAIDRALLAAGLALDEIVGVGVGRGPGSFIGVRTGMATAKGICLGRRIPLVGLPTLLALARSAPLPDGAGFAVIDAKRGEVFAQLVASKSGIVSAIEPPQAMSPSILVERARSVAFVVGNALDGVDETKRISLPSPSVHGLGQALLDKINGGVVDDLFDLVPDYCRAPDAKLPAVDPNFRRDLVEGP